MRIALFLVHAFRWSLLCLMYMLTVARFPFRVMIRLLRFQTMLRAEAQSVWLQRMVSLWF